MPSPANRVMQISLLPKKAEGLCGSGSENILRAKGARWLQRNLFPDRYMKDAYQIWQNNKTWISSNQKNNPIPEDESIKYYPKMGSYWYLIAARRGKLKSSLMVYMDTPPHGISTTTHTQEYLANTDLIHRKNMKLGGWRSGGGYGKSWGRRWLWSKHSIKFLKN